MTRPNTDDFQDAIAEMIEEANSKKWPHIDILSGDLHRYVGGYPSRDHRMATCCHVMYRTMQPLDAVLGTPPQGKGATLEIRYRLPRW